MPDSDDFCPIEQAARDSSIVFALQQIYGDTESDYVYTLSDLPNQGEYYQLRFFVQDQKRNCIGIGEIGTDKPMTHHLILFYWPFLDLKLFLTEEIFSADPPA